MNKIVVNLFDSNFSHIEYSVPNREFNLIEYERNNFNNSNISIFTDNFINSELVKLIPGKKIAMPLECYQLIPNVYDYLQQNYNKFDRIYTHDLRLIKNIPNGLYIPFGGRWIKNPEVIQKKTKKISMIFSEKNFLEGHRLRHDIHKKFNNFDIDFFGSSTKPIETKEEALNDYMFSIVVENAKIEGYFTEKIIDCLSVGTIPIYWGCPNIGDYFNKEGILIFNNLLDLEQILNNISSKFYETKKRQIDINFELSLNYDMLERELYSLLLREI